MHVKYDDIRLEPPRPSAFCFLTVASDNMFPSVLNGPPRERPTNENQRRARVAHQESVKSIPVSNTQGKKIKNTQWDTVTEMRPSKGAGPKP